MKTATHADLTKKKKTLTKFEWLHNDCKRNKATLLRQATGIVERRSKNHIGISNGRYFPLWFSSESASAAIGIEMILNHLWICEWSITNYYTANLPCSKNRFPAEKWVVRVWVTMSMNEYRFSRLTIESAQNVLHCLNGGRVIGIYKHSADNAYQLHAAGHQICSLSGEIGKRPHTPFDTLENAWTKLQRNIYEQMFARAWN